MSSHSRAQSGFTLFEMLIVVALSALIAGSMSLLFQSTSLGTDMRATAYSLASKLRDTRAFAMTTRAERRVEIDVTDAIVRFGNDQKTMKISKDLTVRISSAAAENTAPNIAGIRFFANGSSTGATITLAPEGQATQIKPGPISNKSELVDRSSIHRTDQCHGCKSINERFETTQ